MVRASQVLTLEIDDMDTPPWLRLEEIGCAMARHIELIPHRDEGLADVRLRMCAYRDQRDHLRLHGVTRGQALRRDDSA